MFQSLHQAACRMAGFSKTMSDDDSSVSDSDSDISASYADLKNESTTKTKHPPARELDTTTPRQQIKDAADSSMFKVSIGSIPRQQLLGSFVRTSESVRHLRQTLEEEFRFQKALEEENKLLKNHVDQLGQLITRTSQSQALARKFSNQPIINVPEMQATVEQVSEAATTYALPIVKNVFETFVTQVTTTLESSGLVSGQFERSSAYNFQCERQSTQPMVQTRKTSTGKDLDCRNNKKFETLYDITKGKSLQMLTEGLNDYQGELFQKSARFSKTQEVSVSKEVTRLMNTENLSKKASKPKKITGLDEEELLSHKPNQFCSGNDRKYLEKESATSPDELDVTKNEQLVDHGDGNALNAEEYKIPGIEKTCRIAVILDVAIILDQPPHSATHASLSDTIHSGFRSTFQVLATDSIADAVDKFSQRYHLSNKTRLSLIDHLETLEEAAETFPAKIEVLLSTL